MKVKTYELQGAALDWAVAKCEELPLRLDPMGLGKTAPASIQSGWWVWDGEGQNEVIGHVRTRRDQSDGYSPSTNWAQGGPIIEREQIQINPDHHNDTCAVEPMAPKYGFDSPVGWHWEAYLLGDCVLDADNFHTYGQTPLIAAMRCYVASKLGDEVDVLDELKG